MPARPASSAGLPLPASRRLVVAVRSRASGDVLEVSAQTGGVVGSFDPRTGQLEVLESHDSVAVAAAVGPYLLAPDQPLGTLSARHVAAADRLWAILEASAFTWQRYVPLHEGLLLFYCPLVRLALEIVEDIERDADGRERLGLFWAPRTTQRTRRTSRRGRCPVECHLPRACRQQTRRESCTAYGVSEAANGSSAASTAAVTSSTGLAASTRISRFCCR